MAIQQTRQQSDLEKRLQLLRRQVYGRESVVSSKQSFPSANAERKYHVAREGKALENIHTTNYPSLDYARGRLPTTDLTYLRQDLLKIATIASLAIGAQIFLFFILKNNILKINLF